MKTSSIIKEEVEKFSNIASEWWDPHGKFKPLHKFNPIRIKYIRDNIISHFNINRQKKPFKNLNLLDIGCGGGLLSEPMHNLGANVTGIDASEKNIKIAKLHSRKKKLKINYICSTPEKLKINKKFDIILNMEIVEHVDDVDFFLKKSSAFLKKDGLMFVATINKTFKSFLFAIIGAEYILRWLPIGTHDWEMFVKPERLIKLAEKNFLKLERLDGVKLNVLNDRWEISNDKMVNYIVLFKKF